MPRPSSVTDTTNRRSARMPATTTGVPGAENAVAFSSSSASKCVQSETALPVTATASSNP